MNYYFLPVLFLLAMVDVHAGLAYDNAADTVYNDGWDDGDNGGSGFGGWVMGGNASSSRTGIGSAAGNGGAGAIDSSGVSFSLSDPGNSGLFIDVFRFLDVDLVVGETISLDLDVNFRGGFKGIRFRDADDASSIFRFEIGNPGGGDDHIVYDAATGAGSTGNAYSSDTRFHIALSQTSMSGGTWSIIRSGGISDSDQGTYLGTVSSIQLYTFGSGADAEEAIYFNNFSVVPEPSTLPLLLGGLCSLLFRKKK